ncbi:hypothetical protein FHG89_14240 [Micromonospora orduensis]|uniref:Uncharacterized protein n=1 Tax=Micromonospora orduensis TaxID=1420891 RepID=A0A5C4QPY4_9ACTN|nr:hypothetical protein [Micromonospora orduensis]TNH28794.1 hypothetical protein FHG89_14240 [Micromonospora orduensis]
MTDDAGTAEVGRRVLQVVPAHPDTWVAVVTETAIGQSDKDGWKATAVISYEITVDPVDCWALVEIRDDDGLRQQLLPVCQSWMLTAQADSPLAELVTARDFEHSADFTDDSRRISQPVVVRGSSADEVRKLVARQVPPSGPRAAAP